MDVFSFIVMAVAAYRLGNLLSWEAGPYGMMDKIRHIAGVRYDEFSKPYGSTEVARMVLCVYCNTVWFALFMCVLYYIFGNVMLFFYMPFAVSGLAIVINETVSKE